jgi:hypothetical protein
LVASLTQEDGEQVFYQTHNLSDVLHKENTWNPVTLTFQLPRPTKNKHELKLYIWNTGKNHLYIDDFNIKMY